MESVPITDDGLPDENGIAVRPVVFLHGFGDQPCSITSFAKSIVSYPYKAVLPRMGYACDSPRAGGASPAHFAGDLQALMSRTRRHYLVGYSYGGIVASTYALMVGLERVNGLVIVDQGFGMQPDRTEPPPWTETSDLLWHYDYRHHLIAIARMGIPTLFIIGQNSHVVPRKERMWWSAVECDNLQTIVTEDNHRGLVKPNSNAARYIRHFIYSIDSSTNNKAGV